jgi:epoxyqueuosine reductase QueG
MELTSKLKALATDLGAAAFGVADLSSAREAIAAQGGALPASYPRAVSFGVRLVDGTVNELPRHEDPVAIRTYRGLYDVVNRTLDSISLAVARRIEQAGFRAWPVFNIIIDSQKLAGSFSHKMAAHLAGLGWIGRSCLLITPEHGPRVRLGTVLTDAPLRTGTAMAEQCGDCRECVDICPPRAFTGARFDAAEPRETRYDAHLCNRYMDGRKARLGEGLCGLCVYVCPHGRRGAAAHASRG